MESWLHESLKGQILYPGSASLVVGGLFLDDPDVSRDIFSWVSFPKVDCSRRRKKGGFLSVSLSIKEGERFVHEKSVSSKEELIVVDTIQIKEKQEERKIQGAALNTTKHLWAGAVSAMVSR